MLSYVMLWFKPKEVIKENPTYAMLIKEYNECITRLAKVESRLNGLELENEDLRNKVLRKIQFKKPEEEVKDQPNTTKSLNTFNPFGL